MDLDSGTSANYPIQKLAFGTLGTYTLVSSTNGLPVAQQGTWSVSVGNTVHVDLSTYNSVAVGSNNAIHVQPGTGAVFNVGQSGTWNVTNISGTISLPTGAAADATLAKLNIAQGAVLDSNTGPLVQGSVTTAAPTYTAGQISPLSLTTAGAVRVDNSANTQPISGTVTVSNTPHVDLSTYNAVAVGPGNAIHVQPGTAAIFSVSQSGTWNVRTQDGSGNALTSLSAGSQRPLTVAVVDGSGAQITSFGGSGGTASNFGSAFPTPGTASGFNDGTNMQGARVFDADSGAGTQYVLGAILRKSASGGSVELGTSSDPVRTDPTGSTTQPVSGTVTSNAGTGNFGTNLVQVAGSAVSAAATGVQKVGVVGSTGVAVDGTVAAGTAPTNQIVVGSVYNTAPPVPSAGQTMALQADQAGNLRVFPGLTTATLAAWDSGTALNSVQTIFTNSGAPAVMVQLVQGTTLTAGAVTFEVTFDGSAWTTISADAVIDPTSTTQATISLPYTVQANTKKQFLILLKGATGLRAKLSTQITGSGTVIPNYALLAYPGVQQVILGAGSGTIGSLAANQSVNVAQIAGTSTATNTGTSSAGTLRVVLATDQPQLTNKLLVTPDANSAVNVAQVGGTNISTGNGTSGAGVARVTIASDSTGQINAVQSGTWTVQPGNTANSTPWLITDTPATSGGLSFNHVTSAATNNKTQVKSSAGQLYTIMATNTNAAVRYLKVFNNTSAGVTMGTTAADYQFAIPGNTAGAGLVINVDKGIAHGTGITIAITGAVSLTDNTSISANDVCLTIGYK